MSEKQKKYYLYIDRQAVPVSEQVYRTYHHYGRKEEYFTCDLKTEKVSCDQEAQTAAFTPSREDSYERLLEANQQFASAGPVPGGTKQVSSIWLEDLMRGLSSEERDIITQLYVLDRTERQASAALGWALSTFHRRKLALLQKITGFAAKKLLQKVGQNRLPSRERNRGAFLLRVD